MHRIAPAARTRAERKVGSSVYVVLHGSGTSVIDGEAFSWNAGDVFVTPSWSLVDHQATELADLFAISDRPVLEALHLFRREEQREPQEIRSRFEPDSAER
jgi:gentisate 1,2-dioxygenase